MNRYVNGVLVNGPPPSGAAGGDLSGTYPNPTVDGLQGRSVAATAPADTEVLTWNQALARWEPAASGSESRRSPAGASTPILWECQDASGPILNTGTLGAAGNLTAVGSGVTYRSLSPASTIGPGLAFDGTANGYARGAAGQVIGDGSAVTLWAVVVANSLTSKAYVVARDWATPGAWTDPWLCCSLALGPAGLSVRVNHGGAPGDGFEFDSGVFVVGRQYLIGLTYDGVTLRAWINGVQSGSMAAPVPGPIDWGDPTALWHLGERDGGEYSNNTTLRVSASASVWNATQWAEEYCRTLGNPDTVTT